MDETTATTTAPTSDAPPATPDSSLITHHASLLALAREALIAAHPDAVPELIAGATPDELRASVERARAAYAAVAARVRADLAAQAVPAGAPARSDVSAEHLAALTPATKILVGLRRRA